MLRIFRILKLNQYTSAGKKLQKALGNALPKIIVFLGAVVTLVLIIGALIYFVEGKTNGFTSIPISIYWRGTRLTYYISLLDGIYWEILQIQLLISLFLSPLKFVMRNACIRVGVIIFGHCVNLNDEYVQKFQINKI